MIEHMSYKRDERLQPDRKIFFYSAHDITIINVLQTLGFTEILKPDYGAAVLLELHKSLTSDYEVKVCKKILHFLKKKKSYQSKM